MLSQSILDSIQLPNNVKIALQKIIDEKQYLAVQDIAARDAIPSEARFIGMKVAVTDASDDPNVDSGFSEYQLQGGTENSNWVQTTEAESLNVDFVLKKREFNTFEFVNSNGQLTTNTLKHVIIGGSEFTLPAFTSADDGLQKEIINDTSSTITIDPATSQSINGQGDGEVYSLLPKASVTLVYTHSSTDFKVIG